MKYKNFSEQRAKPKETKPFCEVNIAKVILQAQDILCGKSPTIIPSSLVLLDLFFSFIFRRKKRVW